jgi:hypothetical protein
VSWPLLFAAFWAGVALYQFVVVVLNGYLAAVSVPGEYFAYFGKQQHGLSLVVLQSASALPVVLLVSAGVLLICRLLRTSSKSFIAAIFVGMLACYLYWALSFLFFAPAELPSGTALPSPLVRLQQLLVTPWWALPTVIAPWLGFVLAVWLLRRHHEA